MTGKREAQADRKDEAPATRRRRTPEVARREILDAAERLMAEAGPDAVGLKAVADAAGVSHALVSHYFGTYEALVEAVLARKSEALTEAIVARIGAAPWSDPTKALEMLFAVLSEPAHARLSTWAMLSGRGEAFDRHLSRLEALRRVVDAVEARARDADERAPERVAIEVAVVIALAAAQGYAVGKSAYLHGLGREPSAAMDARVVSALGEMLGWWVKRGD
jgi:AcrR family transcriptional regulator